MEIIITIIVVIGFLFSSLVNFGSNFNVKKQVASVVQPKIIKEQIVEEKKQESDLISTTVPVLISKPPQVINLIETYITAGPEQNQIINDTNKVIFEFKEKILSEQITERIYFETKVLGFDNDWKKTYSKKRTVTLPIGSYVFLVRARTKNIIDYSPAQTIFKINTSPYFDKLKISRTRIESSSKPSLITLSANIKDNETVEIYTGQANKQKQTDKLLEITKIKLEFKYFIIGPKVEELLDFGRINKNVIVTGPIYGNIEDFLSAVDIFILPSKHEGLSNSLLEALSVGLPVIATPVGEAKYIIDHKENGILSKVEIFPLWLDKLREDNKLKKNIKKNARKIVEVMSSIFKFVKKMHH